jgi:uncharacterized protein YidB (DUF937 family)
MSILQSVLGAALGGGQQGQLLQLVAGLVTQTGGIDGLVKSFTDKGMGNIVSSWVGKGQNLPISGDQITQVFGADKIGNIAKQVGLGQNDAASGIAKILPQVVDKLTPDGNSVGGAVLEQGLSGLLKKGIGGLFG